MNIQNTHSGTAYTVPDVKKTVSFKKYLNKFNKFIKTSYKKIKIRFAKYKKIFLTRLIVFWVENKVLLCNLSDILIVIIYMLFIVFIVYLLI